MKDVFRKRARDDIAFRVSVINKDTDECRKYKRLLFEAAVYLVKIGEKKIADLFNNSIEIQRGKICQGVRWQNGDRTN
jgi:hypothetical protein